MYYKTKKIVAKRQINKFDVYNIRLLKVERSLRWQLQVNKISIESRYFEKSNINFAKNIAFSNSGIIKFSADGAALPAKLPFGDHVKLNRQD